MSIVYVKFMCAILPPASRAFISPFKKTMPVAVRVNPSHPVYFEPCLRISFRIQLYKLYAIIGNSCQKGQIVFSCHGMIHSHIIFIFYLLHMNCMFSLCSLRFQRRKKNPAAADHRFSGTEDHVPADRAHIKKRPAHIGTAVSILNIFSRKQLNGRNTKSACQRLQQCDIRKSAAGIT